MVGKSTNAYSNEDLKVQTIVLEKIPRVYLNTTERKIRVSKL